MSAGPNPRLLLVNEWWRIDGWPTAGEWQAVWALVAAALTGILLYVAWKQLHGLSESNSRLAESNTLLAESNRALSRPTVVVEFAFERIAWRNFNNAPNESNVYVLVQNVGASPAIDLTLGVSPSFDATDKKLSAEGLRALNGLFDGATKIRMIAPGQQLKYILDSAKDALNNQDLPAEYVVSATYTDIERSSEYSESFILQMAPWAMSIAEVNAAKQISKDIQFVSENLRSTQRGLPSLASSIRRLEPTDKPGRRFSVKRPRVRGVSR